MERFIGFLIDGLEYLPRPSLVLVVVIAAVLVSPGADGLFNEGLYAFGVQVFFSEILNAILSVTGHVFLFSLVVVLVGAQVNHFIMMQIFLIISFVRREKLAYIGREAGRKHIYAFSVGESLPHIVGASRLLACAFAVLCFQVYWTHSFTGVLIYLVVAAVSQIALFDEYLAFIRLGIGLYSPNAGDQH